MQMVFQDPFSSLNPRLSVGSAILEAGRVHHQPGSDDGDAFVARLLGLVRLSPTLASRHPRELSGGQRQVVAISRAIYFNAQILIMDEPTAALGPEETAMVAKLIAHGADRTEALARMRRALDTLVVEGIKTTAPLHRKIIEHPDFVKGDFSTKWLEVYLTQLEKERAEEAK